jgi:hypothetical protein
VKTIRLFIQIIETAGEEKFKGSLTLTNEMRKQVLVEYACTDPRKGPADVELTSDEGYVSLTGISTEQPMRAITKKDVYLATLVAKLILRALELRDETIQKNNLPAMQGSGRGEFKAPHTMEDSMHDKIFGGKKKSPKKEPFYKEWFDALQTLLNPSPTPAMAS